MTHCTGKITAQKLGSLVHPSAQDIHALLFIQRSATTRRRHTAGMIQDSSVELTGCVETNQDSDPKKKELTVLSYANWPDIIKTKYYITSEGITVTTARRRV